jgi:hypothetical protein
MEQAAAGFGAACEPVDAALVELDHLPPGVGHCDVQVRLVGVVGEEGAWQGRASWRGKSMAGKGPGPGQGRWYGQGQGTFGRLDDDGAGEVDCPLEGGGDGKGGNLEVTVQQVSAAGGWMVDREMD